MRHELVRLQPLEVRSQITARGQGKFCFLSGTGRRGGCGELGLKFANTFFTTVWVAYSKSEEKHRVERALSGSCTVGMDA